MAQRIRFVSQVESADCAAACLSMVLGYFGHALPLRRVRDVVGAGRGGVTAKAILHGARSFGLASRGVRVETDQLSALPPASILHWGFCHFVVFRKSTRRGVWIVDPASGPRRVDHEEFSKKFTGIALTFEPGDDFQANGERPEGLRPYIRQFLAFRGPLAKVILVSALLQVLALALPLLTGSLVDRVLPQAEVGLLAIFAMAAVAVTLFHVMASVVRAHLLLFLHTKLDSTLSRAFVSHLVSLPYAFFLERSTGDLMVRYASNQRIRETLAGGAVTTIFDGTLVAVYSLLVFAISPTMGLLVLGLGLCQVTIYAVSRRHYRELTTSDLKAQSRAHAHLVEMLEGMETLKALGVERGAVDTWSRRFVAQLNVGIRRGRLDAAVQAFRGAIDVGSPMAVLLTGGYLVLNEQISLGSMLAVSALAAGFLGPLARLVSTAVEIQETRSHAERIQDVMTAPSENDNHGNRPAPPLIGNIELTGASFRYKPNDPWILRELSLSIPAGSKVAIVGRSGAGKSTLARIMVGLYSLEAGDVRYDGQPLTDLDLGSVRRQIGIVTQRAQIFGATVRENILMSQPTAGEESMREAARAARVHEDVMRFPMAYETHLAEGGASLSGGQRQRLALARALVRRPAIMLLDEATSELDAVTEAAIMRSLDAMGCTRIVIAHRLSTILNADRIFVLDDAAIVAAGTHRELTRSCAIYAELVAAQAEVS